MYFISTQLNCVLRSTSLLWPPPPPPPPHSHPITKIAFLLYLYNLVTMFIWQLRYSSFCVSRTSFQLNIPAGNQWKRLLLPTETSCLLKFMAYKIMPCSIHASVVPVYDSENVIMLSIFLITSLTDLMCSMIGMIMLHVCKHVLLWLTYCDYITLFTYM